MKQKLTLLTLAIILSACQPSPEQQLLNTAADQVILPAQQHFLVQTEAMLTASTAFCNGQQTQQTVKEAWKNSWQAWQQIQIIRFGPLLFNNQHWKLQFWPDKKNIVRRKVEGLINSDQTLDQGQMEKTGVLVQGLSAQEYLLYDQSSTFGGEDHPRRCQLLILSSQNTRDTAARLLQGWQTYKTEFTAEQSEQTSITSLFHSLLTSVETVKVKKLGAPMGRQNKAGKPRPYFAEAWRSDSSLIAMQTNVAFMQKLYSEALAPYVQSKDAALNQKILTALNTVIETFAAIEPPLKTALTNQTEALETAYRQLGELEALLGRDLPQALNLTLGFNANDGD